jgi:hypothetical protein
LRERAKYRPVFRTTIRQALGMELNGEQERKQTGRFRLQFHAFYNAISAGRGRLQRFSGPANGLVMRAIHAQCPLAGYLEQQRRVCQPRFTRLINSRRNKDQRRFGHLTAV